MSLLSLHLCLPLAGIILLIYIRSNKGLYITHLLISFFSFLLAIKIFLEKDFYLQYSLNIFNIIPNISISCSHQHVSSIVIHNYYYNPSPSFWVFEATPHVLIVRLMGAPNPKKQKLKDALFSKCRKSPTNAKTWKHAKNMNTCKNHENMQHFQKNMNTCKKTLYVIY